MHEAYVELIVSEKSILLVMWISKMKCVLLLKESKIYRILDEFNDDRIRRMWNLRDIYKFH